MVFANSFKKYLLRFLLLVVIMLVITMPFAWFQIIYPDQAHSFNSIFSQHSHFFTLFRWMLIGLLIGVWPFFIRHYATKHQWEVDKEQFWLAQRFRIAGWLIIFELLVCENLLMTLWKWKAF